MTATRRLGTALALLLPTCALAAPGYLRTPDVHGEVVVFAAEGDLWTVPADGGAATRLTTHAGTELNPRFSPDGATLAFSGHYDGNTDVYLLPAAGGEPRRLTWHPGSEEVLGWLDADRVLYRTRALHPHGSYELYTVAVEGGVIEPVPLGWAANLAVDPASGRWAFNRIGREHRTWKRYRGGEAQDIWVGHPDAEDWARVTPFEGTDAFPMWHDGRVWFLSDQGGTANLWSMDPDGTDRTRHTDEDRWDLRWPAMGPDGRIVYMRAGGLQLFDPSDGTAREVEVDLPSERQLTRRRYPDAARHLGWFHISPEGDRVVVEVRGEVFSIPVEDGVTLPVTQGSGARESWPSFAPDGERLVYVTDANGEEAIVTADAWGRGDVQVVVPPGDSGWHLWPVFSPDGGWLAYADHTQTLFIVRPVGGRPIPIDHSEQQEIRHYTWSPDGRFLAYDKADRHDYRSIWVYDTRTRTAHRVTGQTTDDHSPAWDPDGRYLHFISGRHVNPVLGRRDFSFALDRPHRPALVLLRPDVHDPFADDDGVPEAVARREALEERQRARERRDLSGEDKPPVTVDIDFRGITERVVHYPVPPGWYGYPAATEDKLFYVSYTSSGLATERDPEDESWKPDLMAYDLEGEELHTWLADIWGYELAAKGDELVASQGKGKLVVVETDEPPKDLSDAAVSLSDVVVSLEPREEWRQMYLEGWRLQRDFFWDPDMGGLDWEAVRDQYLELLPRVATRDDLRDLMGEVIGELANSHTYLWGGDRGVSVDRVSTGLLGAEIGRADGGWRVDRILRGDPADRVRSPLDEPGVEVDEGDYILAVNRRPVALDQPFEASLDNLAGKAVLLTVSDQPEGAETRDVVVEPLSTERGLRYADWVRRNREQVAAETDGRMGYLHIPDMGSRGLVAFETWFYPQLDREGLVVDARWNGGGFVSAMILERLRRQVQAIVVARGGGRYTWPERALNGPFVVLTNQFAGSDGDIFPAAIQLEGLAPVIGKRSWGGVVGIRADKHLVDGGMITEPEYAFWFEGVGWDIENRGVIPDIEVDNPPAEVAAGRDPQLRRAIEEVLKLREEGEWPELPDEPLPVKTREAFGGEQ